MHWMRSGALIDRCEFAANRALLAHPPLTNLNQELPEVRALKKSYER